MRIAAARVLRIILLGVLFFPAVGLLHAQAGVEKHSAAEPSASSPLPELADIIPLAGDLTGRLALLENDLQQMPDASPTEKEYEALKAEVDDVAARLLKVKASGDQSWTRFASLSQKLQNAQALAIKIGNPLARNINHLAQWKREWLDEKKRWTDWESRLLAENESPQLKAAFNTAGETIGTALNLVMQKLETMLLLQSRENTVRTRMAVLDAEINDLSSSGRRDCLITASPLMYSQDYFSQFRSILWQRVLENMRTLSLPDRRYVVQHGWTLIAQVLLFLAVIFSIHRNREVLRASERWRFLAARPLATGFFVVILTQLLFPEYQQTPITFRLLAGIIGGISFARILRCLVEESWKRQATLGMIVLYILSLIMSAISLPLPLYRLYIFLVSLLALYFLVRWAGESVRRSDPAWYARVLHLGYILLGVIIFAQLQGKAGLAAYLFNSTLTSLAIILAFSLFIYMIRGGIYWLFFSSPVWNIKQLRSDALLLSRRFGYLVEALIVGFVLLPILLKLWGVYASVPEATNDLLALGFNLGSVRISIGLVLTATGTLYGSLLLSWILPKIIMDEKFAGANLERGVRISVNRLIQYFIIFVGFLLTISILGLDLTKLTIILSALGVGIGFGLQGLVNNLFSGLVLLFEQPVRVGDSIEFGGKWTVIKSIGLRSTIVQTFDKADLIIPNSDLISKEVTNWTLSNRQIRTSIPVGVAYGSDVPKVMKTLLSSASDNDNVVKSPPPQVLFLRFGESTLDFELRFWITDANDRLLITSDLNQEIDRRFREAGIEIAFPQRDLHLRSIDGAIMEPFAKTF